MHIAYMIRPYQNNDYNNNNIEKAIECLWPRTRLYTMSASSAPTDPNPQWKEDHTTVISASCFSIHLRLFTCMPEHPRKERAVVTQVPADCFLVIFSFAAKQLFPFQLLFIDLKTFHHSFFQLQIVMRRVLR